MIRDGEWTLFSHDEALGRTVWVRPVWDNRGNVVGKEFRTDYRVDKAIEENTAFRNSLDPGWKGDWHRVASIPVGVFHDKLAEAVQQDDQKYISKFLNDADNAAWRTKSGRV